jgi:hypothetical protein
MTFSEKAVVNLARGQRIGDLPLFPMLGCRYQPLNIIPPLTARSSRMIFTEEQMVIIALALRVRFVLNNWKRSKY